MDGRTNKCGTCNGAGYIWENDGLSHSSAAKEPFDWMEAFDGTIMLVVMGFVGFIVFRLSGGLGGGTDLSMISMVAAWVITYFILVGPLLPIVQFLRKALIVILFLLLAISFVYIAFLE